MAMLNNQRVKSPYDFFSAAEDPILAFRKSSSNIRSPLVVLDLVGKCGEISGDEKLGVPMGSMGSMGKPTILRLKPVASGKLTVCYGIDGP
jgi:hypothetical protein